jgi:ankyrin repeat protein
LFKSVTDEADAVQAEEKQAKLDDEQTRLDDVLLDACSNGSLSDIEAVLTGRGSIVAAREDGTTGLSLACRRKDWDVALPIVKLLLANRFAPSMTDQNGYNALHVAVGYSSAEVAVRLLRKMQKNINTPTNNRYSALTLCCFRHDEEAVKVARVLLDAGADIESVEGNFSRTPLLVACGHGRPELVSLLLEQAQM